MTFEDAFMDELDKVAKIREKIVAPILAATGRTIRGAHQVSAVTLKKLLDLLASKAGKDIKHLQKPGMLERAAEGIKEKKAPLKKKKPGTSLVARIAGSKKAKAS